MEDKLKQSEQAREQLAKELVRTKISLECTDNTIKKQQENIKELKAENERLKEDYIKLYQQKDLDNVRWQKRCTDLHIKDKAKADKYRLVLQEIKEKCRETCRKRCTNDCLGTKKHCGYGQILQLITKAESEG